MFKCTELQEHCISVQEYIKIVKVYSSTDDLSRCTEVHKNCLSVST